MIEAKPLGDRDRARIEEGAHWDTLDHGEYVLYAALLHAEAQIAELVKDKERLDVLAEYCGGFGALVWSFPGAAVFILEGQEGQTLRDAIDAKRNAKAARAAEAKP